MLRGMEADRTTATPRPGAGFEFRENKMRIAAGLIFAGAVSLLASSAAWSQTPPAKGAAPRRRRQLQPPPRPPAPRLDPPALQQSERARHRPHRRDRHDRRSRFRLRAFQGARLPARQGSGADVRRRPVAGEHACGAEDAGGGMHHRHLLPDRQARHLLSRNPQAGDGGRPYHRLAHLVACRPRQQEADRAAAQG